jgi:hypothetical protein
VRSDETVQEFVEVGAVDVIIGGTVVLLHDVPPLCESDPFASVVPPESDSLWFDGDFFQMLAQAPPPEQPTGVGTDLNPSTDFPYYGSRFDNGHSMTSLCKTECGAQTTKTAADYDDIED